MSKSIGNFFTSREVLKEFSGQIVRYFLLTRHYRSPIDFSYQKIEEAEKSYNRLLNTRRQLADVLSYDIKSAAESDEDIKFSSKIEQVQAEFKAAMDDDFNTAEAIGVLHDFVGYLNTYINQNDFSLNEKNFSNLEEAEEIFLELAEIMGLEFSIEKQEFKNDDLVPSLVELLLELRKAAREDKQWEKADLIRDRLKEAGIIVKDTPRGAEWKFEQKEETDL